VRFTCALLGLLALLAACGRGEPRKIHKLPLDDAARPAPFTEIAVPGAPDGLSGLAADAAGVLWSVAERDGELAAITLDAAGGPPAVARFPVVDVPADTDLEGIEVLPDGRFALAAEGQQTASASVLLAEREGDKVRVVKTIALSRAVVGVELTGNHGAESICGDADGKALAVGIEPVGTDAGRRYAAVVRLVDDHVVATQRLWLGSNGKLSALDCRFAPDGGIAGWGIERHYGTTSVLRFTLPPPGQGDDTSVDMTPTNLEPYLNGRLNVEGIAELPDGRVVAINDNATREVTGQTVLLVFAATRLDVPPSMR
jgi:hypothetical protein